MRRTPACMLLALASLACGGCCDDYAASSLTVEVFDEEGDPYVPDNVTYAVDGGPRSECMRGMGEATFVCGMEEAGDFLVTVWNGGRVVAQGVTRVRMELGGCHVASERLELVVEPR